MLELHTFLEEELQRALKIVLQALPCLFVGPVIILALHTMRDQSSHQVKRQLIRQFVVVGEGLEDFEAEIALNKRSSHLEVSNVDEIQHQGKDLIVDLSTYTQLAV